MKKAKTFGVIDTVEMRKTAKGVTELADNLARKNGASVVMFKLEKKEGYLEHIIGQKIPFVIQDKTKKNTVLGVLNKEGKIDTVQTKEQIKWLKAYQQSGAEKKTAKKVKVKNIEILWAEGDNSKYDKFPKKYPTFKAVNDAVKPVYNDFMKDNELQGGYNKVKFVVTWEDNETYTGRLDVSEKEDKPTGNVVGKHIQEWFDWQLKDDKTSAETKKEIKGYLNKYELKDTKMATAKKTTPKKTAKKAAKSGAKKAAPKKAAAKKTTVKKGGKAKGTSLKELKSSGQPNKVVLYGVTVMKKIISDNAKGKDVKKIKKSLSNAMSGIKQGLLKETDIKVLKAHGNKLKGVVSGLSERKYKKEMKTFFDELTAKYPQPTRKAKKEVIDASLFNF